MVYEWPLYSSTWKILITQYCGQCLGTSIFLWKKRFPWRFVSKESIYRKFFNISSQKSDFFEVNFQKPWCYCSKLREYLRMIRLINCKDRSLEFNMSSGSTYWIPEITIREPMRLGLRIHTTVGHRWRNKPRLAYFVDVCPCINVSCIVFWNIANRKLESNFPKSD